MVARVTRWHLALARSGLLSFPQEMVPIADCLCRLSFQSIGYFHGVTMYWRTVAATVWWGVAAVVWEIGLFRLLALILERLDNG